MNTRNRGQYSGLQGPPSLFRITLQEQTFGQKVGAPVSFVLGQSQCTRCLSRGFPIPGRNALESARRLDMRKIYKAESGVARGLYLGDRSSRSKVVSLLSIMS